MLKSCVGLYAMRFLFEATFNPYLSECHHRPITIKKKTVQHDSESSSLTAASWRPPFPGDPTQMFCFLLSPVIWPPFLLLAAWNRGSS